VVAQHLAQPIARDPGREMVDVVDPDVGGEPAQDRRQVEVRAARQGSGVEGPVLVPLPGGARELVLDVEQPHANDEASQVTGAWTSRTSRQPTSAAAAIARAAIARLVARMLVQASRPAVRNAEGSRCLRTKT
jgi:hypothetical protein